MRTFILGSHEYSAENCIDGVLINPLLPDDFDSTPLAARSSEHMAAWYNLPYIVTSAYQADNYKDYCDRCLSTYEPMTEDAFMFVIADSKAKWFEDYPSGKVYWIYCLTSGCWDRPTFWGLVDSLDGAIERVKSKQGLTA